MENWRRHIAKEEGMGAAANPAEARGLYRSDLRVVVKTVEPLSAETVKSIADKVRRAYQREVLVEVQIDPSLLGGIVILIGHRVIDMSLATNLRRMSARIADRLEDVVKELDRTWEDKLHDRLDEFIGEMRRQVLPDKGAPVKAGAKASAKAPAVGDVLAAAPAEG